MARLAFSFGDLVKRKYESWNSQCTSSASVFGVNDIRSPRKNRRNRRLEASLDCFNEKAQMLGRFVYCRQFAKGNKGEEGGACFPAVSFLLTSGSPCFRTGTSQGLRGVRGKKKREQRGQKNYLDICISRSLSSTAPILSMPTKRSSPMRIVGVSKTWSFLPRL